MVQNLIDQVKKAENEAESIVLNAQETKKNLIKKAENDAIEFKKSIQKEAEKKGSDLLEEKKKECAVFDLTKQQEAEVEVKKLIEQALAKEDQVIDKIVDFIFN